MKRLKLAGMLVSLVAAAACGPEQGNSGVGSIAPEDLPPRGQ